MKLASTETRVVLIDFFSSTVFTGFVGADALLVDDEGVGAAKLATGVAERLGSVLTVRSLP